MGNCILGAGSGSSSLSEIIRVDTQEIHIDNTFSSVEAEDNRFNWEFVADNASIALQDGTLLTKIRFTALTIFTWESGNGGYADFCIGWRDGTGNVNRELDRVSGSSSSNQIIFSTRYEVDPFVSEYGTVGIIFTLIGTNDRDVTFTNFRVYTTVEISNIIVGFPEE